MNDVTILFTCSGIEESSNLFTLIKQLSSVLLPFCRDCCEQLQQPHMTVLIILWQIGASKKRFFVRSHDNG